MKKQKILKTYEDSKPVNIRDILINEDWVVDHVEYNEKNGKYKIFATNKEDGRKTKLERNRQYVDNLIQELLDAKQK